MAFGSVHLNFILCLTGTNTFCCILDSFLFHIDLMWSGNLQPGCRKTTYWIYASTFPIRGCRTVVAYSMNFAVNSLSCLFQSPGMFKYQPLVVSGRTTLSDP
jgi:hypothetical protein